MAGCRVSYDITFNPDKCEVIHITIKRKFNLALQAPSLTLTLHTLDPPSNTPHLSGPFTLSVRSTN